MKNWWKIVSVFILVYVFLAGMLAPLKPGITQVEPRRVNTAETVTLKIIGYNSNFTKAKNDLRAWLKSDDNQAVMAKNIIIKNDNELQVVFQMPATLSLTDPISIGAVKDLTLILDNPIDGASVLPSAVFLTQTLNAQSENNWQKTPVETLHEKTGFSFPFRNILAETIRNTYFHVSLWLAMVAIFIGSVYYSIRYLRTLDAEADQRAVSLTRVGVCYGILGLITGAIWAKNTWGAYWSWDVKQNMTAISLLIYFAYFVLRNAFEDYEKQARLSAVYNIFAFAALIPLIYVIPRMTDSLHPGSGGNPALGGEDLDNTMRLVFYPAVIGWTLFGLWIAQLAFRAERLQARLRDQEIK
jgi:heme exporter protein C